VILNSAIATLKVEVEPVHTLTMNSAIPTTTLNELKAEVESVHSWLEDVTYQMTQMSDQEMNKKLAGLVLIMCYAGA
jgi:hypothetical protein